MISAVIYTKQGSMNVEDLLRCYKACENRQVRSKRRRVLSALGTELTGKTYSRIPLFALSVFPSLEWKKQSKDVTRQVLYLLKRLLREADLNAKALARASRIRAVTHNVLQGLSTGAN